MRKIIFLSSVCFLLFTSPVFGQSVDIIWQGESYVPPFYEGRTLWSHQSQITLVAIPQDLGNPTSLNYKWSRNGTVLGNSNGVGRNSLTLVDSILSKPQTIKIEIVSAGGNTAAQSSIIITPRPPELLVYEENPLHGFMFHREIGVGYALREREITFGVFPLFFNVFGRADSNVSYVWRTNAGSSGTGPSAIYRAPESEGGSSRISIDAENAREILQSASKSFLVEFGNENNN